jgi:hypothetical protein
MAFQVAGISFGGYPVYDAGEFLEACEDHGWPTDWADKANSYTNRCGAEPGCGYLLMLLSDVKALTAKYTTGYQGDSITLGDSPGSFNYVVLGNPQPGRYTGLYVARADVIGSEGGVYGDDAAMCLVQVVDGRALLRDMREWPSSPMFQNGPIGQSIPEHNFNVISGYSFGTTSQEPYHPMTTLA